MHKSVRLETPCEFINVTPINPLISKCQIKVCYVGEQPNRNKSVITKEVATQMANSLPGSPIVGYYNESEKDFEEHNRDFEIKDGKIQLKDTTRPFGFVDLGAKCWFAKYKDDDAVEREYLCTEGYLWTGQYPEAKRIVEGNGNNQSMELDEKTLNANWAKDSNGKPTFFIINEAIISKLCILGEEFEPCFEGSNITKPVQFSLEPEFKDSIVTMMNEIKELLKGGNQVFTTYTVKVGDSLWNAIYNRVHNQYSIAGVYEDGDQKFAVLQDEAEKYVALNFSLAEDGSVAFAEDVKEIEFTPAAEPQFSLADVEAFENEFKKAEEEKDKEKDKEESKDDSDSKKENPFEKKDSEDSKSEDKKEDSKDEKSDEDEDKKDKKEEKKTKYILEEIPEYVDLVSKYSALQKEFEGLKETLEPLIQFKNEKDREQKQAMINSFYMLSDDDKADVVANIDSYSLDDIEAKLSVLCVRHKVNFSKEEDNDEAQFRFSLQGDMSNGNADMPAWLVAALETQKEMDK